MPRENLRPVRDRERENEFFFLKWNGFVYGAMGLSLEICILWGFSAVVIQRKYSTNTASLLFFCLVLLVGDVSNITVASFKF